MIIDYQNVNLTALNLFPKNFQSFKTFVNPELFAKNLVEKRNELVRDKLKVAKLTKALVFRGLPSPDYDPKAHALNLAQAERWEASGLVRVTHRPLKYIFEIDNKDPQQMNSLKRRKVIGKMEKGIDVLCALSLVREAQQVGLVILASQDTDLIPAIDAAHLLGLAKIETCSWFSKFNFRSKELRSAKSRILNTRLNESDYWKCLE